MKAADQTLGRKVFLVGVIFVVLLPILYSKSKGVDSEERALFMRSVSLVSEYNSTVNKEVFATRVGMLQSYDEITLSLSRLNSSSVLLGKAVRESDIPESKEVWQRFEQRLSQKNEVVEDFKSHLAVLKNSQRYFPVICNEFIAMASSSGLSPKAVLIVERLQREGLRFSLMQDGDYRLKVVSLLDESRAISSKLPESLRKTMLSVILHGEMMLLFNEEVDGLMRQVYDIKIDEAIDSLSGAHATVHYERMAYANRYRFALFMVAAVLAILAGLVFFRLRQAKNELHETVTQLNFQKYALDQHAIVSISDVTGDIIYVNQKLCDISGFSESELIGGNHRILKSEEHPKEYFREMWRTIAKGDVWQGEVKNRCKNGDHYWVNATIVPFLNKNNKPYRYVSIRTDITQRKLMEEQIEDSRRFLQGVTDAMGEGVYALDKYGRCTFLNPEAEILLGWKQAELHGKIISDVIYPDSAADEPADEVHGSLRGVMESGEVYRSEDEVFVRKDGTEFSVSLIMVPLREGNEIVGSVGVFQDITERKKTANELARAKEEAELASEAKSNFLANMSHEIRTPLNGIIGLSHLALQSQISDKLADYLSKIQMSSKTLLSIINDILDFSKIEADRMPIEVVEFSLSDVLNHVGSLVELKVEEKGLELYLTQNPDIPLCLVGDPLRLGQVLLNLVNNAVKFTHEGDVIISVEAYSQTKTEIMLRFKVKDTGIGLSEDQINKLFQSFSQADASTTRKYGGTGLGLVISKRLVNMMGGEISVESQPGEGSTFIFTSHFALPSSLPKPKSEGRLLDGLRVLLVDARGTARSVYGEMLKGFGFDVVSALTIQSAMQNLNMDGESQEKAFDMLLIQRRIAGCDAGELIQKIRSNGEPNSQPRIFIIESVGEEGQWSDESRTLADAVIKRPINSSLLFDSIFDVFLPDDVSIAPPAKPAKQDSEAIEGILGAQVLLVEDNGINQQVATELLESYGAHVTIVDDGLKAVKAVASENFDLVFMDCQMPGMDGYEATKLIRSDVQHAYVPIVAMTANAMTGDREQCLSVGMDDYISKPINPDILFKTLVRWIKPEIREPAKKHEKYDSVEDVELPDSIAGINLSAGLAVVNGNKSLYRKLLQDFFNDYENVAEDLDEYIKSGRHEESQRLMHTLKSVSLSVGAKKLGSVSADMEAVLAENKEISEAEIKSLRAEVEEVMGGISDLPLLSETKKSDVGDDANNINEVRILILRMQEYLRTGDSESLDVIDSLKDSLSHLDQKFPLKKLEREVNDFEFESALITLQSIIEKLNIAPDQGDGIHG